MEKRCIVCDKKLRSHAKVVYCLEHKTKRTKDIFCAVCNTRLFSNNQLGLCRTHRRSLPIGKKRERAYYMKHYQKNLQKANNYRRAHLAESSARASAYMKKRMATDPLYKLHKRLQEYTSKALKRVGGRGYRRTIEILGAEMPLVKKYIENQFTTGMSWSNYGKWHIDHVFPLSSAKSEAELLVLCRYTNLQPMWASLNYRKSDRLISYPFGV